jgi:hypothetical protein
MIMFITMKTNHLRNSLILFLATLFGVAMVLVQPGTASAQPSTCLDPITLTPVPLAGGERPNPVTGVCEDIPEPPIVVLTINGGSTANIVNGESVTIEWYIDGNVANCTITNIGPIDVSALPYQPISGSTTYTPPNDSSTEFTLNCDGVIDSVGAAFEPEVTMSIDGGNVQSVSPTTGVLEPRVRWSASNATRCELMRYQREGIDASPRITSTAQDYNGAYRTSGDVRFDGWPMPNITTRTTFFIECENEVSGARSSASTTLDVLVPPPPSPVWVSMWADATSLDPDPLTGYATTRVYTRSGNRTWCEYRAFQADGVTPLDHVAMGFEHWGGHANRDSWPRFSTTTVLEFECSRPAVTLGTTTYPAEATSTRLTISLNQDPLLVDRTLLPPVTVELVPTTSTSTVANALNGRGTMTFTVQARNAEYCYLRAYRNQNNTNEYNLQYWTRTASHNRISGNGDTTITTSDVSSDTSFFAECIRSFDQQNFPPGSVQRDNGYASTSQWIELLPAPVGPPPLDTFMYANPLRYEAEDIRSNATENVGFTGFTTRATQFFGNQHYIHTNTSAGPKRVTFPFPYDSGTYSVMIAYCDQADGEAQVNMSVDGSFIGAYTMDQPNGGWNGCGSQEYFIGKVSDGIPIAAGNPITLECTPDGGEDCWVESVIFAQAGDRVIQRAPGQPTLDVDILYDSEFAEGCRNQFAQTQGGASYRWAFTGWRDYWQTVTIATTTTFGVECFRNSDVSLDTNSIEVRVPATSTVTTGVGVASGSCLDNVTLLPIDAPPGFQANPVTGICEPAVDLAATPPALSGLGTTFADPVAGTYDNVGILMTIENYGPGALPANSSIAYLANMTFAPVYSLPVLTTALGDFDGALGAPSGGSPTVSGTLVRTFDDVPFGTHNTCVRVNLDGSPNYPESNPDPANNVACDTVTLPVPQPPMSLSVDREIIRTVPPQPVTLSWDINVTYEMNCTVRGAGGLNVNFNTLVTGPAHSDSFLTAPIDSTSEFLFQCTEPITGTTFTERLVVEVVDGGEEI